MGPEQLPLPAKQFRRYLLFWHLVMVGSLLTAVGLVVWNARADWGWQEVVVVALLLMQMGIYLRVLISAQTWSQRRLFFYFASSIALWLVEYWLAPDIYWIVFAYIGQMFGMLPARFGVVTSFMVAVLIFGRSNDWDLAAVDPGLTLGMAGQWVFTTAFYVFINHLMRTSQERGRLIAELEAAKKELEVARQREAELAVLRERERLARDLHDGLGHALVALSVQLEAIQRLYRVDPERASAQVEELKALTRSSMTALRRSLAGLRAPGLGDRPLQSALREMCSDFRGRAGVDIDCQVDKGTDELSPALAEALWRVAQEALTNVDKHAHARHVQVTLQCGPQAITLRVVDDGTGLPAGAESGPNRFGLRGMRERVEGLGGTLSLRGSGNGTVVEASLPIITANGQPTMPDDHAPAES